VFAAVECGLAKPLIDLRFFLEPLTFCMPRSMIPSEGVALGLVGAGRADGSV
jgi:hypothetical protein